MHAHMLIFYSGYEVSVGKPTQATDQEDGL